MSAETDRRLTEALTAHLIDEGMIDDGEFVGDWIGNVYLPSLDARDGESAYALIMSGGTLPDHVAVGLLTNALDRVRGDYGDES